jgi:DNA-binding winged helix-turn-helix (wHTH) protein
VLSSQMMKLVEYIAHKADEICIQDFILWAWWEETTQKT